MERRDRVYSDLNTKKTEEGEAVTKQGGMDSSSTTSAAVFVAWP